MDSHDNAFIQETALGGAALTQPVLYSGWLAAQYRSPVDIFYQLFADAQAVGRSVGIELPEQVNFDGAKAFAANSETGKHDKRQGFFAEVKQDKDGAIHPVITFHSFREAGKTAYWNPRDILFNQYRNNSDAPKYDPEKYKAKAAELAKKSTAARKEREALESQGHTLASQEAIRAWGSAQEGKHPYLTSKRIKAHGARVATETLKATLYSPSDHEMKEAFVCNQGDLLIPIYSQAGTLVNLQRIKSDGSKLFLSGGQTTGCFYKLLGSVDGQALVAEGFATAASVCETTGRSVYFALSASNLKTVCAENLDIGAVAADSGKAGIKAATDTGLPFLAPEGLKDGSDWNDYVSRCGFAETSQALAQLKISERQQQQHTYPNAWGLCRHIKPTTYLVDDMLEEDAHGILGGASQTFKSFVALRLAHSICSGNAFMGKAIYKKGAVVYVAGEGQNQAMKRVKALCIELGTPEHDLIVMGSNVAINSTESMAELGKALQQIKPVLVIFDTFASLAGGVEENSNSEVGAVLNLVRDTCRAAGASSLIVHHFGKDAEKGFRGASAFLNNVDFAYSAQSTGQLQTSIQCVKMKDGEFFKHLGSKMKVVPLGTFKQCGKEETSLVAQYDESQTFEKTDAVTNADKAYEALTVVYNDYHQRLDYKENPAVGYKEWKKSLDMLGYGKVNLSKEAKALIDSGRVEKLVSTIPNGEFRPIK